MSCPLPFEFRPFSSPTSGGSNDPSNPLVTGIPNFEVRSLTTGETVTTLNQDVAVTLLTETKGAAVYYTIVDGASEPPKPQPGQAGTFLFDPLSPPEMAGHLCCRSIRAIAIGPNMYPSLDCWATFTIEYPMAAPPTFEPLPGAFETAKPVTISTTTPGASIYHTVSSIGVPPDPTPGDPGQLYGGPIDIVGTETTVTIKAIAVADQLQNSPVVQAIYEIGYFCEPPTFSPPGGMLVSPMERVQISSATPGAQICYFVDDLPIPSPSDPVGPLTLPSLFSPWSGPMSYTIYAIAHQPGWTDSAVSSMTYTMDYVTDYFDWDWQSVRDTIDLYQECDLPYEPWYDGPDYAPVFLYETDQGNVGKMMVTYCWGPEIEFEFTTWDSDGSIMAGGMEICLYGTDFDLDYGIEFGPGPEFYLVDAAPGWFMLDGYMAPWFSNIGMW